MKEGSAIPHKMKTATFAPTKNKTTPSGVIIWYDLQKQETCNSKRVEYAA